MKKQVSYLVGLLVTGLLMATVCMAQDNAAVMVASAASIGDHP